MNEHFVCVKVDREERPDVDAIYMDAVQAMTGHGGWPLNAFLTPDGVPFYAGTYFPPRAAPRACRAGGRCSSGVAEAWREQRDEIDEAAARDRRAPAGAARAGARPTTSSTPASLDAAVAALRRGYDARPRRLRRRAEVPRRRRRSSSCSRRGEREMALHTLRAMAARRDLRPGRRRLRALLRRRALDRPALREDALRQRAARPRLPARLAGHAASRCSGACARRRWTGRCASCARPRAASPRALDADSEGVEGKFYVWTLDELRAALGDELRDVAIARVRRDRGAATSRARTSSVRRDAGPAERCAEIKARAAARRASSACGPGLDDKRLTAWNALMISALADAGAVLGARRLPRRRGRAAPSSSCATCATPTAGCCAPTTAAGRSSPPTWRTTRSCSRRC